MLWILCAVMIAPEQILSARERLVHIAQGPVRGYEVDFSGVFVYYGIPYAKAPTGPDKFKAPLPAESWVEPLEAVDRGIICPQITIWFSMIRVHAESMPKVLQEDCLIANLYVPDTEATNLPVVVYVHGGGYILGYGDMGSPIQLVKNNNIIAVTFNYRLGVHGFLCLGTKEVPGNAGLKDQVALLRWVKSNIASFGGNPDDVTIAGYSAGASAVDLLAISKITNGLFSKVIPESGANTAVFSIQSDPIGNAKMYAKLLNFTDVDDIDALEEFYKTATYEMLTRENFMNRTDSTFVFSPCVERYVGEEIVLDDGPVNIIKNGNYKKTPMLYGFAKMEGLMRSNFFETWKDMMNKRFSDFLPADLYFRNDQEREIVAQRIKEFYFGKNLVSEDNILKYIDYFSDVIFAYPALRSIKLQVEAGNKEIYLYEYSYVDENTPLVPFTNVLGASHGAQAVAIMDGVNMTYTDESTLSDEAKKHKQLLRELWGNFIITGNPVPESSKLPPWPPVSTKWSPHMSLGQYMELRGSLLYEQATFWDDIYESYYRAPTPPNPWETKHSEL